SSPRASNSSASNRIWVLLGVLVLVEGMTLLFDHALHKSCDIPPPGPTVSFYGNVALEVNASTSQYAGGAIQQCFENVYGNAATTTTASTATTTTSTSTTRTTTTGGAALTVASTPQLPNLQSCAGQFSGVPKDLSTTADCWFAYGAYSAVRQAYAGARRGHSGHG
ncbi:MAG: hypothetical protein ACLP0J_08340, partial [Solirubrobacteraceae bacterium]